MPSLDRARERLTTAANAAAELWGELPVAVRMELAEVDPRVCDVLAELLAARGGVALAAQARRALSGEVVEVYRDGECIARRETPVAWEPGTDPAVIVDLDQLSKGGT